MASFDDDDPANGSGDEFDNEDEEMEDVDDAGADADQDGGQDDDEGGEDEDEEEGDDEDEDEEDDQNEPESPSRRESRVQHTSTDGQTGPEVVLTSPSPRRSPSRGVGGVTKSFIPSVRPEALTAAAYDIVPTMAAPQSTSINAITSTPDMRWVFSGGSDGYVRMYNWVETANGKVPLTVAQKHPFVDSVMKAGSLLTYWENEEASGERTPPSSEEGKWTSPVYSLAVQHQALWLLSGLESGGINLQTCRHGAGTRVTTLREHTNAVSVLDLSQDETTLLSGSWDKIVLDWDLHSGKVKRSFRGSGGQISAIETRPLSDVPVPEVTETIQGSFGTFSSNNADRLGNGVFANGRRGSRSGTLGGDEDAMGSPTADLFGENENDSLFGEDSGAVGTTNAFDDTGDELARALQDELNEDATDATGRDLDGNAEVDAVMGGMGSGGPVQPADAPADDQDAPADVDGATEALPNGQSTDTMANGSTSHHPQSPPATTESSKTLPASTSNVSASDLTPQSESTFLSASINGALRIWDRRMQNAIATISPYAGTPPWCTGACWSPDGNAIYAGRRNCAVDEYNIHKLGSNNGKPDRTFRFQQGSGNVYAVRSMPNGRHLVW
jgi:transcriptional activator SPT8